MAEQVHHGCKEFDTVDDYLNQWDPKECNENFKILFDENEFENVICGKAAMMLKSWHVNEYRASFRLISGFYHCCGTLLNILLELDIMTHRE